VSSGVEPLRRGLRWGARLVHPALREKLLWAAHRGTGDQRLLVLRAEDLQRLGRLTEAVGAYRRVLDAVSGGAWVDDRQALQFAAARGLHRLGERAPDDPLFAVEVAPGPAVAPQRRRDAVGSFDVRVSYMGLRVSGQLRQKAVTDDGIEGLEVRVGDALVRRLPLPAAGRAGVFGFLVRRPALAVLPPRAGVNVRAVGRGGAATWPLTAGAGEVVACTVPFGDGTAGERARGGPLVDKKGRLRRSDTELATQQAGLLALYERAARAFERLFDRPLFLLYGTLLGLHRQGDFIPGDDDFDVGYVSSLGTPRDVKAETLEIMRGLVREGFEVGVNRRGKPFRIREPGGSVDLHLDARPLWQQDGRVWAHKQASLDLPIDAFGRVRRVAFRGVQAAVPEGTEVFLEAYYGAGWRVPDPAYSNDAMCVAPTVVAHLAKLCLTRSEIKALGDELNGLAGGGAFYAVAYHELYPLDVYERRVGW